MSERIGRTGMADLYRAVHPGPNGFEKTVVVKAMLPAHAENHELVEAFTKEANVTAQLSHPGIAQVYDYGVDQGIPFVVVEDLDGINLLQLMSAVAASGKRLPLDVAVVIATEICQALGFAHSWRDRRGVSWQIVHADVSPESVMVCRDGSVKLLDFGVARVVVDPLDDDLVVKAKGNFAYMAPEQVNRQPFDRRVDVFAVGVMLHELLTGRRLFGAQSDLDTLRRVHVTEVKPPSLHNPEVTPELDLVVLKAVARDPDDRFTDGTVMATALQQVGYVGGGRRRVAEFMTGLFPESWQIYCDVCQKQLAPVLMCVQCTNDEPAPRGEAPAKVEARVAPAPRALEVDLAREKGVSSNVPPPPPRPRPVPASSGAWRALAAVGIVGILLTLGVDIAERRRSVPEPRPAAPQAELPIAAAPPVVAAAPPVVAAPPVETAKPTPRKLATRVTQRPLPRLITPAAPTADRPRVETAQKPSSFVTSDPRLLDPFDPK